MLRSITTTVSLTRKGEEVRSLSQLCIQLLHFKRDINKASSFLLKVMGINRTYSFTDWGVYSEKRRLGGSDGYFITEGVSCGIEIRLLLHCFGK